jgi:hypothetical protein
MLDDGFRTHKRAAGVEEGSKKGMRESSLV